MKLPRTDREADRYGGPHALSVNEWISGRHRYNTLVTIPVCADIAREAQRRVQAQAYGRENENVYPG